MRSGERISGDAQVTWEQVIGHVIRWMGGCSRDGKGLVSRWKMKNAPCIGPRM